jgi:hypothetical protein
VQEKIHRSANVDSAPSIIGGSLKTSWPMSCETSESCYPLLKELRRGGLSLLLLLFLPSSGYSMGLPSIHPHCFSLPATCTDLIGPQLHSCTLCSALCQRGWSLQVVFPRLLLPVGMLRLSVGCTGQVLEGSRGECDLALFLGQFPGSCYGLGGPTALPCYPI